MFSRLDVSVQQTQTGAEGLTGVDWIIGLESYRPEFESRFCLLAMGTWSSRFLSDSFSQL
jgi:hypothetical protein